MTRSADSTLDLAPAAVRAQAQANARRAAVAAHIPGQPSEPTMAAAEPLIPLLWPPGFETRGTELYAILDGARDPRIHKLVSASELVWRCLYAGRLAAELLEVAPYLVQLQPDAAFTRTLLAAGWGHAWGIWLVSAAPFDELRHHLRRFLRVKDERGRQLLFRYYDPIVLAAFLPTCTAPELAELFGPIDAFLVESDAAGEVTELWFDGTALRTRSRAVKPGHSQPSNHQG